MRVLTLRGLSELLSAGRTDLIVVGSSGPMSDLRLRFDESVTVVIVFNLIKQMF